MADRSAVPVTADEGQPPVGVEPPDDPVETRVAEAALYPLSALEVKEAAVALEKILLELARESNFNVGTKTRYFSFYFATCVIC